MSSWFVFSESELGAMEQSGYEKLESLTVELRDRGEWTDDGTLLVKTTGIEATQLAAAGKLPRRMARDPPIDTSESWESRNGSSQWMSQ